MELLIKNASIIDGTGKEAYIGNIGISNGKIITNPSHKAADLIIDATGKYVAPGFIDVHSHGDELIGAASFGELCKINQGVTTQIVGQCGNSSAPTCAGHPHKSAINPNAMNPDLLQKREQGLSWAEYINYVTNVPKITNIKLFVGYNTIRNAVMGYDNRKPTLSEMNQMKAFLKEAMEAGAAGMSSGLAYVPATYSDTDELVELSKVMVPYGGIYTTHMRNESWDLLSSVNEAIEIGRRAGVAVNISHFKVMGRPNWGTHVNAIKAIEKARTEGLDITCDQYPYNCSMTNLAPCIPPWHFSNGTDALLNNLKSAHFREIVKAEMCDPKTDYENLYLNAGGWNGITVCSSPNAPKAEGHTITEYANNKGIDPFDAFFDLIILNQGTCTAVYHSISDDDMLDIIKLPFVMVGSDGLVSSRFEKCHPRGWGTMVRAICAFCKERPILSLEELIHRITGMPARRYSLTEKGFIKDGYDADVLIFNYEKLRDNATYTTPTELASGIDYVLINGKIVYCYGNLTNETPGKLL